ncbi:DUF3563 family protein [Amphibiibacter pelophylacis]|uniref:DUF3563 family protein n=1 Tax=Amphibiibacter pelophylacis TaxID=1799477 RepID=A0ACC6P656_9BURK
MSSLKKILRNLVPSFPSQRERDEAWLNESSDLYELEARMAVLDRRGRQAQLNSGATIAY